MALVDQCGHCFFKIVEELFAWVWLVNTLLFKDGPLLRKSSFGTNGGMGLVADLITAYDG